MQHDRTDASKVIHANKTDSLRERIICHYWYFPKINFRFQPKVCDVCHDTTQKSMNFDVFAIATIGRNYYSILFWFISKDEGVSRMNNDILNEKSRQL